MTLVTKEEDLPDDLYAPGLKLFVCSTNAALQRKVVDACDTLTTSLGPVSFHPPFDYSYTNVIQDDMKFHEISRIWQYLLYVVVELRRI